jgi:hypothetical protein
VLRAALAQLPGSRRPGKNILVRIDGAGGIHELLAWLTRRRLSYSVGFSLPGDLASIQEKVASIPDAAWTPAYDANRQVRPGAFVAEVTGLFDLTSWPPGMRLIVRKERPHPGAQLRITDVQGMRITAFVTNSTRGQLADLEPRPPVRMLGDACWWTSSLRMESPTSPYVASSLLTARMYITLSTCGCAVPSLPFTSTAKNPLTTRLPAP